MLGNPSPPEQIADIPEIAVGIRKSGRNLHAGIIFRDEGGKHVALHIGLNGSILHGDAAAEGFSWAVPQGEEPLLLRQVALLCENIVDNPPDCIYALKYAPSSFYADGTSVLVTYGPETKGFTCATFVLAILHSRAIDLLDHKTWEYRDEDGAFEKWIVDYMKQHQSAFGITDAQIEHNAAHVPCIRFRPEETVAACLSAKRDRPLKFKEGDERGRVVRDWVKSR